MGTRGVIARATGEGTFEGRYHHWDSYPDGGLGQTLFHLYNGHFQKDAEAMLRFLIDEHKAGWSTINGADFLLPAGYEDGTKYQKDAEGDDDYSKPIPHGPFCYCHGKRHEEAHTVTERSNCGGEWAYIIDPEKNVMHVCRAMTRGDKTGAERPAIGMFGYSPKGSYWTDVAAVELDGAEPDWGRIQCGESYERCTHYAYAHYPELRDLPMGRLSTQTFLGRREFQRHDAIAFEVGGTRYTPTGSGRSGTEYVGGKRMVRNVWKESVKDADGREHLLTVAEVLKSGYKPWKGVTWVMPPRLTNPEETRITRQSLRQTA